MIGRPTTRALASFCVFLFGRPTDSIRGEVWIPWDPVYDFFYGMDFSPEFCNAVKNAARGGEREFREFFMKLHTGETVPHSSRDTPRTLLAVEGQALIRSICGIFLTAKWKGENAERAELLKTLKRNLELDGYVVREGELRHVESSIVDVESQHSALLSLAKSLGLDHLDVMEHHLKLTEDHYANGLWDDCIGNARKVLESCLQECAQSWSAKKDGAPLQTHIYESPSEVRNYLRKKGLLTTDEFNSLRETYGLLSATGNHPNIAASDQARMLRQMALLYSEFVMLRLQGSLAAPRP